MIRRRSIRGRRAQPPAPGGSTVRVRRLVFTLVGILVAALLVLIFSAGFWSNWLWFGSLGFQQVLGTRYVAEWSLFGLAAVVAALFFGLSVRFAARRLPGARVAVTVQGQRVVLAPRLVGLAILAGSLVVGFLLGSAAAGDWPVALAYLNRTTFGIAEPVFNRDAAFYIFTLPVLEAARSWALGLLILTLIGVAALGLLGYGERLARGQFTLPPALRGHLSLLGALTLALFSFSYWLANFDLLFSTRGVVFGAGATDLAAQRPANYLLLGLSLLAALLLAWNAFARRTRPLVTAVVAWAVAAVVVGVLLPAAYQSFIVKPSEQTRETPYIANNIKLTRQAYKLEGIATGELAGDASLDANVLSTHADTIGNIRLWDYRPLLTTYQQIQRIRQYYEFQDVDIDRYQAGGSRSQVMLSARELDSRLLPSQTWINRHLIYTHGYGAVVSPVNRVTAQGLPELSVQDLPPTGQGALAIARPEI